MLLALLLPNPQGVTTFVREEAGGGPEIPNEWDEWVAGWAMDEESGTRAAIATSVCGNAGSDCDLADNAPVEDDQTNKVEGVGAALFVDGNDEFLDCANATCDEITGISGSVSYFTFARTTADTNVAWVGVVSGSSNEFGWMMYRKGSPDDWTVKIGDGSDEVDCTYATTHALNTYYYQGFTMAGGATDEVQLYEDGAAAGSACAQQDMAAASSDFMISSNYGGKLYMRGQIDLSGVFDGELTAAEHCYTCSCGPGNEFGCVADACEADGFSDYGQNVAQCGSCDMSSIDPCDPY